MVSRSFEKVGPERKAGVMKWCAYERRENERKKEREKRDVSRREVRERFFRRAEITRIYL